MLVFLAPLFLFSFLLPAFEEIACLFESLLQALSFLFCIHFFRVKSLLELFLEVLLPLSPYPLMIFFFLYPFVSVLSV
jgi:hypothetical protein